MKTLIPLTALAALVASSSLSAQTPAFSKPSGYVSVVNSLPGEPALPPASDAALSVPLSNSAAFIGKSSVTTSATSTLLTLGAAPSPAWQVSTQWTNEPHLLIITEGSEEGLTGLITDNGLESVTIISVFGELSNVAASTSFRIEPAHTLLSLFPLDSIPNGTQVIMLSEAATAVNLGASKIYTKGPTSWITTFGGSGNADNVILYPGEGFIIRSPLNAGIENITFTGEVPTWNHKNSIRKASGNAPADNFLGYNSPVPIAIKDIGIPAAPGDQVILFDSTSTGRNKGASQILTRGPSNWFGTFGPATGLQDNFLLGGPRAFIYRRAAANPDQDVEWTNTQTYRENL